MTLVAVRSAVTRQLMPQQNATLGTMKTPAGMAANSGIAKPTAIADAVPQLLDSIRTVLVIYR
jgi:hypothetical protein